MSILKQQRFDLRSTIARKPFDMRQKFIYNAPMVKWISQRSSEPLFWVRILVGAQMLINLMSIKLSVIHRKSVEK